MSLDAFAQASLVIQVHTIAALVALIIGPVALYRARRDRWHRRLGYVWVGMMVITAASGFFIWTIRVIGPFSPIHLLSVLTLGTLWVGTRAAIRRDIATHQTAFRTLYWYGLILAGLFTFLPGRTLNGVFFDANPSLGWAVIACGVTVVLARALRAAGPWGRMRKGG